MITHIASKLRLLLLVLFLSITVALQASAQKPELVVQAGHRAMIKALALSADNRLLASAGADNIIIIWDVASRKQILYLAGHTEWIFALAFSPDGRLASGSYDGTVKIWNIASAKVEYEIPSIRPYSVTSLAFSPFGDTLAIASANKVINLWDMKARKLKSSLQGHSDTVTQIAFSHDGNTLTSSSLDKTVRLWNLSTLDANLLGPLPQGITSFAYSPDENVFAIGLTGGGVGVIDRQEKKVLAAINFQGFTGSTEEIDYRRWRRNGFGAPIFPAGTLAFISNHELAFLDGVKLRMWDAQTKTERELKEIKNNIGAYALAFNQNDKLLIYSDGEDINLLNTVTVEEGQLKGSFGGGGGAVFFSPDGQILINYLEEGGGIWTTRNKQGIPVEEAAFAVESLMSMRRGATSQLPVWGGETVAKINGINIELQGEKAGLLKGHSKPVKKIWLNLDDTILASSGEDGTLLWDLKTQKSIYRLDIDADDLQFSRDGKFLAAASGGERGTLKICEINNPGRAPVVINATVRNALLFSPDNQVVAARVVEDNKETPILPRKEGTWPSDRADIFLETMARKRLVLKLWKATTGELINSFDLESTPKDFNPASYKPTKDNLEPSAMHIFGRAQPYATMSGSVAYSSDGKLIASDITNLATGANDIKIWEVGTGREVHTLTGHTDSIRTIAFSPNGKILVSGSWDKTLRFWNTAKGQLVATTIPFDKDDWVMYTPEGRFNTNLYLDETTNLTWIWPDDALRPLSVRVFLRDYYEPNLLRKILAGDELKPVRDLSTLNRTQPTVRIKDVKPDGGDTVQVTVEVAETVSSIQRDAKGVPLRSGLFDVKLFRDKQLVGSSTTDEVLSDYATKAAPLRNTPGHAGQELALWRAASEVKLGVNGKAELTFRNIQLPHNGQVKEVRFSAYAFNSDRITSDPAAYIYKLTPIAAQTTRRAYVITVGVDANQLGWDLNFAAKSAEDMRQLFGNKLLGEYQVINIPLLSTFEPGSPRMALNHATKENIRTVLNILAGKVVDDEGRKKIPNASALRAATPDDLMVLYMASHGYADPQENFYVIPNVARGVTETTLTQCLTQAEQSVRCAAARSFLDQSISGDELTLWLRSVDAGEILLILDSCYSATLSGRDFKPGPLGDRSFGQLAYDKGMMILAATQKTAVSTPRGGIQGTLLSSALISSENDFPKAQLAHWLDRAEYTVPKLYKKLFPEVRDEDIQAPVSFDFTKKTVGR